MTTARITSLSPQVYAKSWRPEPEAKAQFDAGRHPSGLQADPSVRREGSAKMPGIGDVVDVLA